MDRPYHVDPLDAAERARLEPWVSNLDSPAFVLNGLSQVTAAALFARYSRSPKSLRRLLLDEFLEGDAVVGGAAQPAGRRCMPRSRRKICAIPAVSSSRRIRMTSATPPGS